MLQHIFHPCLHLIINRIRTDRSSDARVCKEISRRRCIVLRIGRHRKIPDTILDISILAYHICLIQRPCTIVHNCSLSGSKQVYHCIIVRTAPALLEILRNILNKLSSLQSCFLSKGSLSGYCIFNICISRHTERNLCKITKNWPITAHCNWKNICILKNLTIL